MQCKLPVSLDSLTKSIVLPSLGEASTTEKTTAAGAGVGGVGDDKEDEDEDEDLDGYGEFKKKGGG